MDRTAKRSTSTDEVQARIAREHAQRLAALWLRPSVSDREAAAMLGVPYSTWCSQKRCADFPPHFVIGRRYFYRTEDLRGFIDRRVAAPAKAAA